MKNKIDYFAAMAMSLPSEFIDPALEDEDMIEDAEGAYKMGNNKGVKYYYNSDMRWQDKKSTEKRYKIRSSFEYRLARTLYRIAEAMAERSCFITHKE